MYVQFLCYFFTTCDSDKRILLYECCYHITYMVVTAVCLCIQTLLACDRVLEKCFCRPGKVLEFFCNQESRNPVKNVEWVPGTVCDFF